MALPARLQPAALLAPLALLAACASPEPETPSYRSDPRPVSPPAQRHVREAVEVLGQRIETLYDRWPGHLPRSGDFPDLPLVKLLEIEDRGGTGADTTLLTRALEEALRFQGLLRLHADELAVPPSLREAAEEGSAGEGTDAKGSAEGAEIPEPGLVIASWVDRVGRFRLELYDRIQGKALLRAASGVPH